MKNKNKNKMNVEKNTNEVDELCEQMTAKVLSIVLNEFPEKIKEIDKLRQNFEWKSILTLKTANMQWITNIVDRLIIKQCCNIDIDGEQQKNCIQNGENKPYLFHFQSNNDRHDGQMMMMIETNKKINQLIEQLKPYIIDLIDLTSKINFVLEILSPKIQDGHNFGVLVQTKAMYYMADVYHSCCGQLLTLESYYSRRRSSLNYCMLNPQLIDYQIAHNEIERDTMYTLCSTINQLYHFYAGINDFVEKNLQKLIQPRD